SGYLFFLKGEELAKINVNTRINNASLNDAMNTITKNLGLEWVIKDKTIILRLAEKPAVKEAIQTNTSIVVQDRIISGNVVDESGNPLEGATVLVKGTTTLTTTGLNGSYRITLPANGTILLFSNVGFES